MCFDEGQLLAYLDGEVTAEERRAIEEHLASCASCARTLDDLAGDRAFAADALGHLRPAAEVLQLPPVARPAAAFPWARIAAAAAAAVVLASFAFAPVRSAAADFLSVFRVQKVQTISLTQDDITQIRQTLQKGSGHIDMKSLGEAWVEGGPRDPKQVTLAQAQAALDFPVKLPSELGSPQLLLQAGQTVKFKLHVDAVNQALQYYGSDRTLPASVDGKVFEVRVPTVLVAKYGDAVGKTTVGPQKGQPFSNGVFVGQARSPQLIVPEGVDATALRDVLLNLPVLPQNVRDQLAAVSDWQSTLLVPAVGGQAHDISIDGVPAVVMSPDGAMRSARVKAGESGTNIMPLPAHVTAVLWNQDGVIRAIAGSVDETRAITLARTCMK